MKIGQYSITENPLFWRITVNGQNVGLFPKKFFPSKETALMAYKKKESPVRNTP